MHEDDESPKTRRSFAPEREAEPDTAPQPSTHERADFMPTFNYRIEIDRRRCEGKAKCAEVCPNDVFEVRRIDDSDFRELPMLARLKSLVHLRQTAYASNRVACAGCFRCVSACPEHAITVTRER